MASKQTKTSQVIIEESPQIYKLLVSSVRDYAIFLLDCNGYISTWNAGAEAIKQYTKSEIVGKHFSVFYTPEDKLSDLPSKLLAIALEEGRVEDEGWRVRKDGTRFWADVILTAIYDETGKHIGFAKITRDMTEQRHLVREREEAMLASTAKSAFLANMSHELRTPLTAIIGYAEMLDEERQSIDPETMRDYVSKIMFSGNHLMSIISDILDLSKIEAGGLELQMSQVNVKEVMQEVSDTIKPLAAYNGNTMCIEADPDVPPIMTDRLRLRQILYNLFSNAVKFTHNGTITAVAKRDNSGLQELLRIEITDTGVGMEPKAATEVFDRFRQVNDHVQSYNQGGTGLGLAICRMLTEAMDGTIHAESVPGQGSTFIVKLPLKG